MSLVPKLGRPRKASPLTPPPQPIDTALTLEQVLTSPDGFGLVTASPCQRAICRVAQGLPLGDLASEPAVRAALGTVENLPTVPPKELYLVSGSRVGKTLFSAALAFFATQTVDVTGLGPGDEPRIPILSLDKDKAAACYMHLVNTMKARPHLRELIVREGRNELDSLAVWLRHPSGREIQVCVAAGKAAGNAVVSYFLAGVIFDEFCKMQDAGDAVVNFEDSRKNSLGRLLPGAQLVGIGSPWAPFGPAYDAVQTSHGKPSRRLVVVHARGRDMNPAWWTPERIADLDDDVLRTEELALFLAPETSLLNDAYLDAATRVTPGDLPYVPRWTYMAEMDPATRGNAWTLVIVTTNQAGRLSVVLVREWIGSRLSPLSPRAVLGEVAELCARYRLDVCGTDQWSADANRDLAQQHGLTLTTWPTTAREKLEDANELLALFADGQVEIPPDKQLREDLVAIKRRITQEGVKIILPKTGDGRHCDYAPPMFALARHFIPPPPADEAVRGSLEWQAQETQRLLGLREERVVAAMTGREWKAPETATEEVAAWLERLNERGADG